MILERTDTIPFLVSSIPYKILLFSVISHKTHWAMSFLRGMNSFLVLEAYRVPCQHRSPFLSIVQALNKW